MKKMVKVLLTIVVALTMVLGMSVSALADDSEAGGGTAIITTPPTGTLTINNTVANKTIDAYKIFDATVDLNSKGVTYELTDPFFEFFKKQLENELKSQTKAEVSSDVHQRIVNGDDAQRIQLAKMLLEAVSTDPSINWDSKKTIITTTAPSTIQELAYGFYLLCPAGATDTSKSTVKTPAMLVNLTDKNETITMKSAYPTVEKTVDEDQKVTTAQIGDEVEFKLESYVPDMTGYTGYTYYFKDELPEGLALPKNNDQIDLSKITVKVGDTTLTAGDLDNVTTGDYSVQPLSSNDFAIVLNRFYTKYYDKVGKKITVTYKAVVTENAVVGTAGNKNTATVTYSNNPATAGNGIKGDGTTTPDVPSDPQKDPEDPDATVPDPAVPDPKNPNPDKPQDTPETSTPSESTVYTFDFDLFKYHKSGELEEHLAGAKFQLLGENQETVIELKANGTNEYLVQKKGGITDGIFTTTAKGDIKIKGLKEGIYYLHEVEAPQGYNLLDQNVKIVIGATVNADTKELQAATLSYAKGDEALGSEQKYEDSTPTVKVENKSGAILPSTGSTGTILFTIFGIAVLSFMTATSIYSRKKHAK